MLGSNPRVTIIGLNYAPEPTGIAPYTTRLAERLVASGYSVHVVTGYPHYPVWKRDPRYSGWQDDESLNGVPIKRLRHFIPSSTTNLNRMHMELSFGVRLILARWSSPDVILMVSPSLFASALVLLRAKLGPSKPSTGVWIQDIYCRGLEETGSGNSLQTKLMKKFEGIVFRSATGVTVIHDRFREFLINELGVTGNNIEVIRNWTHLRESSHIDRLGTRRSRGWGTETVVLHAGNMGVKQALENVVEAARTADALGAKVKFVLLGGGNQRNKIQAMAKGIDRIEFISPVPDEEFNAILHSADILLVNEMPGLKEMAVPSKLTSYFSAGLPVIAATESNSTTAAEVLSSGGGLRVDPGQPEALLEAVLKITADPALSEALGRAGQNYARNVLSEETAIIQYSAWLRELAAAK
ncbi:glycosyltransferase involved in cell wall biosynthesis [Arthrobacter silviterrae]|uniref:D-inositol 3-phosphate glycosyltransferase n=1 Tax=Arthrobacter silviterrae TaxID=2026658 RepID=A0ABX0DDZ1_9MICC|nr:glycosyltransferase family 4 protein [Arthrobacter silviterrae]MDQ0279277.1 glycosyltransferase involved in cell wall biosynthesis [Arthrobacter silviterrae]NGN83605.1 glycosyltransferase family 4 protein [Arthrobacter silviterrae]